MRGNSGISASSVNLKKAFFSELRALHVRSDQAMDWRILMWCRRMRIVPRLGSQVIRKVKEMGLNLNLFRSDLKARAFLIEYVVVLGGTPPR